MNYWWIALIIVGLFVIESVLVWLMRNNKKLNMIILYVIATILIVYKTIEFSYYRAISNGMYPVEFSHISYFILGVSIVLGIKKLYAFAGFCSALAGLGYVVAGIASPDSIVTNATNVYYIVAAIVQHELLWFAGAMLFMNVSRYSIKQIYIPIIGVAIMIVFSVLVYNGIIYKDFEDVQSIIIIQIITGRIIEFVMADSTLAIRIVTAVIIGIVAVGILCLYYVLNNKIFNLRKKNGVLKELEPFDTGIIHWIKNKKSQSQNKKDAL